MCAEVSSLGPASHKFHCLRHSGLLNVIRGAVQTPPWLTKLGALSLFHVQAPASLGLPQNERLPFSLIHLL